MKIENGKYYRTRDGQKVGPMAMHNMSRDHMCGNGSSLNFCIDGSAVWIGGHCPEYDLIAEWTETDLTAITTPFGLLDAETQKDLRDHGGPYEGYTYNGWREVTPMWLSCTVYRVKPKPITTQQVLYWQSTQSGTRERTPYDTHKITITLEGDKPTAIRIEELK